MAAQKISIKQFLKAVLVDPDELVRLIQEKGDVIELKFPGLRMKIMSAPEAVKHVFFTNPKNYIRDSHAYKGFNEFFFRHAFESETEWKKDKDALGQLLTKDKMVKYAEIINQTVKKELDSWEQYADTKNPIAIDEFFSNLGLQSIRNTLLGGVKLETKQIPKMTRELFHFVSPYIFFSIKLFGYIPIPSPLYFRYQKIVKQWEKLDDYIVRESFKDYVNENNAIKHLAKNFGIISYDELNADMKKHLWSIAAASLVAGNDSTDGTLLRIGVILSLYPEIANKMREEAISVLGSNLPRYEDLEKLPYIRAVIKEILRLFPPMTIAPRTALHDDEIAGHKIKKGEIVLMPSYALQRDYRYWDNPVGFDPTRFLKPLDDIQRLVYMPFSLGERSCLGAQYAMTELTIILAQLVRRYRFELNPGDSLDREAGLENRLNTNIRVRIYRV